MTNSKELLETAVRAADLKRAEDIVALDVAQVSLLADYFMICHGNNPRQIEAIANEIVEKLEEKGATLRRIEGKDSARWILIDFGDIIIHVFNEEERAFYDLEKLWGDAPMVDLSHWVDD